MKNLPDMDAALNSRIDALCEEGRELYHSFDMDVRQDNWHPFVAADYDCVREALVGLREPGSRFLEWGSAMGVITVMADLMGFEASGIEIDALDGAFRFGCPLRDRELPADGIRVEATPWRPANRYHRSGPVGLPHSTPLAR